MRDSVLSDKDKEENVLPGEEAVLSDEGAGLHDESAVLSYE